MPEKFNIGLPHFLFSIIANALACVPFLMEISFSLRKSLSTDGIRTIYRISTPSPLPLYISSKVWSTYLIQAISVASFSKTQLCCYSGKFEIWLFLNDNIFDLDIFFKGNFLFKQYFRNSYILLCA